jgi:hypothetical protein
VDGKWSWSDLMLFRHFAGGTEKTSVTVVDVPGITRSSGRANRLIFFRTTRNRVENDASNNYSIFTCVFVAAVTL